MRLLHQLGGLALVLTLTCVATTHAQVVGGVGYNPYTGNGGRAAAGYNPYTGRVRRRTKLLQRLYRHSRAEPERLQPVYR